jgi:hypothetical protein
MSKVNKVLLIIGTTFLVLGIIIGTTAFALARFDFRNFSTTDPSDHVIFIGESTDIDTIRFYGVSDDIQIDYGPVKTIEIDYWENDDFYYVISENHSGHDLVMKFENRRLNFWPRINITDFTNNGVTITIPESFTGTLNITTVSGTVTIDAPSSLESIDIDTVSGDVSFTCDDLGSLEVDGISANLGFSCGTIGTVKIDTVSGDVDFSSDAIGKLKFNSTSGCLEGLIADKADNYTIDTDTLSGNMNIPRAQKGGKNTLNFNTLSGDARIMFEN